MYDRIKRLRIEKEMSQEELALKSQVDNGEIAAVPIDNEATLKRVYIYTSVRKYKISPFCIYKGGYE